MTLKQLNCFLTVAETLNFARAAEKLYTTQPSVTRSIKSLEEELGVTLFSRHSRKVELTPAGSYLQDELRHMSQELNAAIQNTQKIHNQFSNEIRIGVTDLMELPYLPQTMQEFHEENPAISLQLHVKEFRELVQALIEEKLDLIYCMRSAVSTLKNKEVLLLRKGGSMSRVGAEKNNPQK
ncbi:MAG: LysR family transcriptional regulator [Clostridiales bacterium]|nr:LysR family transcriptional regulator [Clostridiales bacterium]